MIERVELTAEDIRALALPPSLEAPALRWLAALPPASRRLTPGQRSDLFGLLRSAGRWTVCDCPSSWVVYAPSGQPYCESCGASVPSAIDLAALTKEAQPGR